MAYGVPAITARRLPLELRQQVLHEVLADQDHNRRLGTLASMIDCDFLSPDDAVFPLQKHAERMRTIILGIDGACKWVLEQATFTTTIYETSLYYDEFEKLKMEQRRVRQEMLEFEAIIACATSAHA